MSLYYIPTEIKGNKSLLKPKSFYLNEPQRRFLQNFSTENLFFGGRGSGKTHGIGYVIGDAARLMPRGTGILLGPTFDLIKNTSLGAVKNSLRAYGYSEYDAKTNPLGNFVSCAKPPKHFKKPLNEIETYQNAITFLNGHTVKLYSFTDMNLVRGNSIDYILVDEAGSLDEYEFNSAVITAMRNPYDFQNILPFDAKNVKYYQTISYFTSLPWKSEGEWLLNYEARSKKEEGINFVRCTSYDNVKVIGEKILKLWEAKLLPAYYQIEVMCQMPDSLPTNFYINFDEKRNVLDNIEIDPKLPLILSFDFNNYFTCCVVAQKTDNRLNFVGEFFVESGIYMPIIEEFLAAHGYHQNKHIILTGDRGKSNKVVDLTSSKNDYDKIQEVLQSYGWSVQREIPYRYDSHSWKYKVINHYLAGTDSMLIQYDRHKCYWLQKATKRATTVGNFQKDKSREGLEDPRISTHLPDAGDYGIMVALVTDYRYN